jgi:pyruvate ferredoxin oxidoreductase delta subunit
MSKQTVRSFRFPAGKGEMPVGPYAEAGVLVETNAGWRVFRPILDGDKCVKCQKCWLICPDGVIDRTGAVYAIDYNFCKGCGLCAYECPRKAIRMVKEGENGE